MEECPPREYPVTHSASPTNPCPFAAPASPLLIPVQSNPLLLRPMRCSMEEGLNQEIEKLVLNPHPGPAGRANRLDQVSALRGGTPEPGNHSPLTLHGDDLPSGARSANAQTPVHGFFSHLHASHSDDSLSPPELDVITPEDDQGNPRSFGRISSAEASPRINKFLAQLPPEGCERVLLKLKTTVPTEEATGESQNIIIKPGFQLRPSQGSAFRVATGLQATTEGEEELLRESGGVTETPGECSGTPSVIPGSIVEY